MKKIELFGLLGISPKTKKEEVINIKLTTSPGTSLDQQKLLLEAALAKVEKALKPVKVKTEDPKEEDKTAKKKEAVKEPKK